MYHFIKLGLLALFVSSPAFAQLKNHYVIAKHCLVSQMKSKPETLAKLENFSLLRVHSKGLDELIHLKSNHRLACGGFVNVSREIESQSQKQPLRAFQSAPYLKILQQHVKQPTTTHQFDESAYKIAYPKEVNEALQNLNPDLMWKNLNFFSSYYNRHAGSKTGVEASDWIKSQAQELADTYHRTDIQISTYDAFGYPQKTVVAKVGEGEGPGIVISAHLDGVKGRSRMPAADDDGSGTVTVMEAMRSVLASGIQFKNPIYFIWYAAEEEGLVGSNDLVSAFVDKKIPIKAVLHFDLTGYAHRNDLGMWLITDHVNLDLTNYLEQLIQTYVKRSVSRTACGYACSDHASWTDRGFAAAISAEAKYANTNPHIHRSSDTMDHLSLIHMTDYAKLAIAFAIELAEPK